MKRLTSTALRPRRWYVPKSSAVRSPLDEGAIFGLEFEPVNDGDDGSFALGSRRVLHYTELSPGD